MNRASKVKIEWSPSFAYAIGLIVTDGSLSIDGRHINFTSKDKELVELFMRCLNIKNHIGMKARGGEIRKKYYVVQFGDVNFYSFLVSIGITPQKSKRIAALKIPSGYLLDFLRGHFDGDGTFYSYWDPRWKSSYMFYFYFYSASGKHIMWLQRVIAKKLGITGHVVLVKNRSAHSLRFAKRESLRLVKRLYSEGAVCLLRKRLKIEKALSIIGIRL